VIILWIFNIKAVFLWQFGNMDNLYFLSLPLWASDKKIDKIIDMTVLRESNTLKHWTPRANFRDLLPSFYSWKSLLLPYKVNFIVRLCLSLNKNSTIHNLWELPVNSIWLHLCCYLNICSNSLFDYTPMFKGKYGLI
jgi:hypothetical protein